MEMPSVLELWTADEVAECLEYEKHLTKDEADGLCKKLWLFLSEAKNPTPLGGDGSNGTVETPYDRLGLSNDDKAGHWWSRLTKKEQAAIAASIREKYQGLL